MAVVLKFPSSVAGHRTAYGAPTLLAFSTRSSGLTPAEVADIAALVPDLAGRWTLRTRTNQSGDVSVGLVPDWCPSRAVRTIQRRGHRIIFQDFARTLHMSVIGNDGRGVLQRGQPEEWEFVTMPAALAFIREKHRNRLRERLTAERKARAAQRKAAQARDAQPVMEILDAY